MDPMSKGLRTRGVRHAQRMSLYLVRSKRHANGVPCTLVAGQGLETTGLALRLVASVGAFSGAEALGAGISQTERAIASDYPENLPASYGESVVPSLSHAGQGKPAVLCTLASGRLST